VYNVLFIAGIHPECWKESIGIILLKPGKPDYLKPKAYRIIVLLNCLGKTLEKIIATRLSFLANSGTGLLHPSQLGGRKQRLVVDIVLLLLYYI